MASPYQLVAYGSLFMGALAELRAKRGASPAEPAAVGRVAGLSDVRLPGRNLRDMGKPLPGEDTRAKEALARSQAVLAKATLHEVRNIDERVSYIGRRIKEDSLKPQVREAAISILSRKCSTRDGVRWCTEPKNYGAEVQALYTSLQEAKSPVALRYVRDHLRVDQFTAANKLLFLRGGDCDDGTILLGALLNSVGYPVKMRVIQDSASTSWSHIYLLAGLPPGRPDRWVPLDWSVYPFKPAGWEAPGAAQVALTGKPSGMVTRLKDYNV